MFTLQHKFPRDAQGVVVRSLNLRRVVVMIEPQQEGVAGPWPQWQSAKEVGVVASEEITEGGAQEQYVQRRLGHVRG